jgi:hypothetical protein
MTTSVRDSVRLPLVEEKCNGLPVTMGARREPLEDTPLFCESLSHRVRQLGTGKPSESGRQFSSAQAAKSLG